MSSRQLMLLVLLCVALAQSAAAQTGGGRVPAAVNRGPTFRGFGTAGLTIFSATKSFQAIFDRSTGELFGGGLEVGLSRHLFVSLAASRFARTGHRLFAFQDQVFDLNQPTTIGITPVEVSVGYRYMASPRLRPYAGGGIGWYRYEERSTPVAATEEQVRTTFTGYHVLAGVETPIRPWVALAGEAQFTGVPNALGLYSSGVSRLYDEHDLGGFTLRVKVVLGR